MKNITKQTIGFYVKSMWRHPYLSTIPGIVLVLSVFAAMALPFFYKEFVDTIVAGGQSGTGTRDQLMVILFQILAIDLVNWSFWRGGTYAIATMESSVMEDLSNQCFAYMHGHSYNFFNNAFVGSLVKKINRMVHAFEELCDRFYFEVIPIVLRIIIATVVLFTVHVVLGAVVLVWIVIFVAINYGLSVYKLEKYDLERTKEDSKLTGQLADTIANNVTIKMFGNVSHEKKSFAKATNRWRTIVLKSWYFNGHIEVIQGFLMVGLNFFVLYFAIQLWTDGILTVGYFVLLQSYLLDLFNHLWNVGRMMRHIYERFADAEEMMSIIAQKPEIMDEHNAREIQIHRGGIEFDDVSFWYDSSYGVLEHLSFRIKPGETLALIGPSGGGKSTLVKLLLRLFDVTGGHIDVDGENIRMVTQDSLRRQIALVPQDPMLFHRSLKENIRYGNLEASDQEVVAAAKLAHCDEFISKLAQGYETFVGERGVKLSGGQRQRVAIARAILSNTKILVLDEATSSLDSESERFIQDALKNLMRNKTTIIIAHRLSTVINADRILVLEKGKIVEEGSHAELIRIAGGTYKKLWDLQVGGYLD